MVTRQKKRKNNLKDEEIIIHKIVGADLPRLRWENGLKMVMMSNLLQFASGC